MVYQTAEKMFDTGDLSESFVPWDAHTDCSYLDVALLLRKSENIYLYASPLGLAQCLGPISPEE